MYRSYFHGAFHQLLTRFWLSVAKYYRETCVPLPSSTAVQETESPADRPELQAQITGYSVAVTAVLALILVCLFAARSQPLDAMAAASGWLLSAAFFLAHYRWRARRGSTAAGAGHEQHGEADADEKLALFRSAVNHMSQGLCMFGPDLKLIMSNTRYAELYHIPPEQMRPGMPLAEIVACRMAAGNRPAMGEAAYTQRLADIAKVGEPAETVVEQEDGRVFLLGYVPLPGGGWVATHQDITDRRLAEAKIAHMARHDTLTNLPNRASFHEQLEQSLTRVGRGESLAVLCLDLDRFKSINDTLGHHFGDLLLQEVANRLRHCVREMDTVARLSGDEFAIVQVGAEQPAAATTLARRIVDAIAQPYDLEGHQVAIAASIGIAVAPGDGVDSARLLKGADMALYRAKDDGRATYRFFEPEMDARMQARRVLESQLRRAIARREFTLHYQSIVNLKTGQIDAFEALARWNHPERGLLAPADFIPIAEETGLIVAIGEWVIRQACKDAAGWPEHIKIAVNLSPVQLRSQNLVPTVASALARSGLTSGRLELEITETVMLQDRAATLSTLLQLRALGARISMDDFGTGYSSLSNLKKFPFDKIKIDRSFIHDMGEHPDSVAIVRAVSALGKSLGMTTTAEGVETSEQLECVRSEGYTEVQGYFFSRPRPAEEITELLTGQGAEVLAVA